VFAEMRSTFILNLIRKGLSQRRKDAKFNANVDKLVKSRKAPVVVIPAKAGIQ